MHIIESATKHASIALYQDMCQNIAETEEHLKTIRPMNAVKDNLSFDKDSTTLTSGSFGEGLDMQGSDLDVMYILKYYEVLGGNNIPLDIHKTYFAMETDETIPGFSQLRLLQNNHLDTLELIIQKGRDFYISSAVFKMLLSTPFIKNVHGPCLTNKDGCNDLAIRLHYKSWINPAFCSALHDRITDGREKM